MGQDTPTNGQATESQRNRASKDKDARASGPYDKSVRLCLNVPLHIVKRLESHAVAMGKSRDTFATECLGRYMKANYKQRDECLRNAYNATDESQEE